MYVCMLNEQINSSFNIGWGGGVEFWNLNQIAFDIILRPYNNNSFVQNFIVDDDYLNYLRLEYV